MIPGNNELRRSPHVSPLKKHSIEMSTDLLRGNQSVSVDASYIDSMMKDQHEYYKKTISSFNNKVNN
jgi:hypothetical protein